jgi:hypothetical protein
MINDADGFANVRSGPGKSFNVVDTLYKDDFFYFKFVENSDWAQVTAWKGRQIEGFLHKSRIQEVKRLDVNKQKRLIIQVLDRHKNLADDFHHAWQLKDSVAYGTSERTLGRHSDTRYDPILDVLPDYLCATSDE